MNIDGKKMLITGTATGIGRASALEFARRGAAHIVLADIDRVGMNATAQEVRKLGVKVDELVVDVSDAQGVVAMIADADQITGGLDIVFNNAGIMTGAPDFPETDLGRMLKLININLVAMMVGTHQAIATMRKRRTAGVILNTSSIAALSILPADPAYAVSKVGVVRFVESCEPIKASFGIRVMAICPGITETAIVPKDAEWLQPALESVKMLQPIDIAKAACDIVEDDSQHATYVVVSNDPVDAVEAV